MSLAFDAALIDHGWLTATNSVTKPCVLTGSNLFVAAGVATYNGSANVHATTVVWNTSESLAVSDSIAATVESAFQNTELWWKDAPTSGSHNMVYTLSGFADFVEASCQSYTGKTSTGIEGHNATQNTSASASSPACNITVTNSDVWLLALSYNRNAGNTTAGTGTTKREDSTIGHAIFDSNGVVSTGSQTLAATTTSATWPGFVSIAISAAGTPDAAQVPYNPWPNIGPMLAS